MYVIAYLHILRIILNFVQVYKDRYVVEQLVRRAERAGFKAIALTVDTPRLGRREADIKNRCKLHIQKFNECKRNNSTHGS